MCGCNKAVAGPIIMPKSIDKIVSESIPCYVTKQELEDVKSQLIAAKTVLNSAFVNRRLGYIDTMINKQQYCLYSLSSLQL